MCLCGSPARCAASARTTLVEVSASRHPSLISSAEGSTEAPEAAVGGRFHVYRAPLTGSCTPRTAFMGIRGGSPGSRLTSTKPATPFVVSVPEQAVCTRRKADFGSRPHA